YTYITFAAKPNAAGLCTTCTAFTGSKTLKFTNTNFPIPSNAVSPYLVENPAIDLGDGVNVGIQVKYEGPTPARPTNARREMGWPRAAAYNSLWLNARQLGPNEAYGGTETTTLKLSHSLAASFEIFDIDAAGGRWDFVSVVGRCHGGTVLPRLTYVQPNASQRTVTIQNNTAYGNRYDNEYSNINGRIRVDFDMPVDSIVVVHTARGKHNGSDAVSNINYIGIGQITFTCPPPPPPVNEDGLSFTKEAPLEAQLCEEITMTYRLFNANCADKPVNFEDVLDAGLEWITGSVTVSHTDAIQTDTDVNNYGETQQLKIENLYIPGFTTLIVTAKAKFTTSAIANNKYGGDATIKYDRIIESIPYPQTVTSCDRYLGCAVRTETKALNSVLALEKVKVKISANKGCYKANDEITCNITIENPNSFALSAASLILSLPERFDNNSAVPGTCQGTVMDGLVCEINNIVLGASSSYTYTLKIKAPTADDLIQVLDINGDPLFDEKGKPVYQEAITNIMVLSTSDDVCEQTAFSEAEALWELKYCNAPSAIITNENVTMKIKR
ncbi:MAG: hypothetical protein LBD45_07795, partial [Bacteroidales bacterium]|nr:hypothetical protein [Bacteroidales bacterium]